MPDNSVAGGSTSQQNMRYMPDPARFGHFGGLNDCHMRSQQQLLLLGFANPVG